MGDFWGTLAVSDKVRLHVDDGIFEGVVHTVDIDNCKIVLSKVVSLASAKHFSTIMCFFGHEINRVEVVAKNVAKSRQTNSKLEVKRTLIPNDNVNKIHPLSCSPIKQRVKCDVTGLQESSLSEESDSGYGETTTTIGSKQVPSCIISKLNSEFYDVIKYIKAQAIIGLNVEGIDIGRFGKLCWLQIATKDRVFLFDMLRLSRDFFEEGLKDIMESPSILKVTHDCRQMSDMFCHQFLLSLVNVFDTQVADILVHKLNFRALPRNVKSLPTCLIEHLKLRQSDVHFPRVSAECRQKDLAVWKQRPLPADLREAAVKDVIYLRELRVALMELLLSELVLGVDVYLSVQRDAPDDDVLLLAPHTLPKSFQDLVDNANRRRARNAFSIGRPEFHRNGVVHNHIKTSDPDLHFRRDMWHSKLEKDTGIIPLHRKASQQRHSLDSSMPTDKSSIMTGPHTNHHNVSTAVEGTRKVMPETQGVKKKLYGALPAGMQLAPVSSFQHKSGIQDYKKCPVLDVTLMSAVQ